MGSTAIAKTKPRGGIAWKEIDASRCVHPAGQWEAETVRTLAEEWRFTWMGRFARDIDATVAAEATGPVQPRFETAAMAIVFDEMMRNRSGLRP